jgi:hypothetical protein
VTLAAAGASVAAAEWGFQLNEKRSKLKVPSQKDTRRGLPAAAGLGGGLANLRCRRLGLLWPPRPMIHDDAACYLRIDRIRIVMCYYQYHTSEGEDPGVRPTS